MGSMTPINVHAWLIQKALFQTSCVCEVIMLMLSGHICILKYFSHLHAYHYVNTSFYGPKHSLQKYFNGHKLIIK